MVFAAIGPCFRHPSIANKIFLFLCLIVTTVLLILFYSYSESIGQTSRRIYSFDWEQDNLDPEHQRRCVLTQSLCKPLPTKVDKWTMYSVSRQQLMPLNGQQPLLPYCGNVYNDISFSYPINPTHRLASQVGKDKANISRSVFITVISAPGNFEKRRRVRETWAKSINASFLIVSNTLINYGFFIGSAQNVKVQQNVTDESLLYGDIIQVDLSDAYVNLTLKTVALLHWANNYCHGIDFILKTDDDVFVNVYNFVETVHSLSPETKAVYGYGMENRKPVRAKGKKWTMGNETWPWEKYPSYLLGGCYMISRTALGPLLAAASTTPFFVFEDIYLNGLCAPKAQVVVQSSKKFVAVRGNKPPDACFVRDTVTWVSRDMNVSQVVTDDFFEQKTINCSQNKETKEYLRFKTISELF